MVFNSVIGLEVHAQLRTKSKLFCGCSTEFGADPNTLTCPICLGMPGTLPMLNQQAVLLAVKAALAFNCHVHKRSLFARKNYFYPDLPKGYQITQFDEPLAEKGHLEICLECSEPKPIAIRRIHLEEDAGKMVHEESYVSEDKSLVDFNRCGIPLIEIVTEPVISSAEEARLVLVKIHQIVRWLGICDGNMEEGSLRCDANVSVCTEESHSLGVKTELKNMNSFSGVKKALSYEIDRQIQLLKNGIEVVHETLFWDGSSNEVIPVRGKETPMDYRYFPEPDLNPLKITSDQIREIKSDLPELPDQRKERWISQYKLAEDEASLLTSEKALSDYFEEVATRVKSPRIASNWVRSEVLRLVKEQKCGINQLKIRPVQLAEIIRLIEEGRLSQSAANWYSMRRSRMERLLSKLWKNEVFFKCLMSGKSKNVCIR